MFAGFSAESLSQRIIDCKPKVIISCNAVRRGAKTIHLKEIVDNALVESAKNGVPVGMYAGTCLNAFLFMEQNLSAVISH